jgi:hypothetical protein
MSDDTPTQRFDTPATPAQTDGSEKERKSRLPLILGIIGGVLLIAVIILLILLLNKGGSASPTSSPTPTATPSASPSPTPTPTPTQTAPPTHTAAPPVNTNVTITGYSVSGPGGGKIDCSVGAPASAQYLTISWTSVNGVHAYFGVNTTDAEANGMGWVLPPNGDQTDFPSGYNPYSYICGNASQTYTITVTGPSGKVSKTIQIDRKQ